MQRAGITGEIAGYTVIVAADLVHVLKDEQLVTRQRVDGITAYVLKAKDLRLGWAAFDDFEVIYLYDKADENFGYAVNLADSHLSEWGYAPFETM